MRNDFNNLPHCTVCRKNDLKYNKIVFCFVFDQNKFSRARTNNDRKPGIDHCTATPHKSYVVLLYRVAQLVIDCYTVLTWWQKDCQWGMRHGLQLAGITILWLVGLNIDWDCLVPHCIMGSRDQWEFPPFSDFSGSPFPQPYQHANACRRDCARGLWKSHKLVRRSPSSPVEADNHF